MIDLRSKTDSVASLQEKMREYINNGTQLGWLINPQNRTVEIYRPHQDAIALDHPNQISDEDILPNFLLDLQQIWD